MTKAKITIDRVTKSYRYKDSFVRALEPCTLEVREGEFVCILGPSGCGKSTLLRMVAGLVQPSEGRLLMDGVPISGPAPQRGLVFQEYALFPWMSVKKNVMYGPMVRGLGRTRANAIARDYIARVGLNGFEDHLPRQLSGGMKQRIGIARVLANDPDVLLMDEPFGALDSITRGIMQQDLMVLWNQERKTVLFVTHSVEEAIYLADRIVVMSARPGRIETIVTLDDPRPRDLLGQRSVELRRELTRLVEAQVTASGKGRPAVSAYAD
jgi:ABC-type nitrate/sulfonate/bicarbonate transport system ATPase subunit